MKTIVFTDGQMKLPRAIMDALHLEPGTVVDVHMENGRAILEKNVTKDPLDALYGSVEIDKTAAEYVAELRDGV